ncbi:MAG: DUF1206 domain-containing protein [Flavobacteriales bacterium]
MADQAQAPLWKHRLFVVGHVAKGVVFFLIGGLGTYAMIRGVRDPQGILDVLVWVHEQAFGKVLVTLLGLGLLAHGAWRWWKVFDKGSDGQPKVVAIGERLAHVIGGTFYILLSLFAISMLWIKPKSDTGNGGEKALRFTLKIPWGEWLVGLVGAIVILVGIFLAVRGCRQHLMEALDPGDMQQWKRRAYRAIGMAGYVAWGMVNAVIGYFLIRVAMTHEPDKYRGIRGALEFLGGRTFGFILLGAVSVGLLLFGVFMIAKARYHHAD